MLISILITFIFKEISKNTMTDKFLKIGFTEDGDFKYPINTLNKHFVALGSSGSGKTVFCKNIIEEAALNNVPAIVVDPQGDLGSLSIIDDNTDEKIKETFKKNISVTIFTPTSSKGIPICINPLNLPKSKLDKEEMVSILGQTSNALCELIGYDLSKDDGKSAQALFYLIFEYSYRNKIKLGSFNNLIQLLNDLPTKLKKESSNFISSKQEFDKIIKRLKFLTVGDKELLFEYGVHLDIDLLLGKKNKKNSKTQVSVINLNSLESQDDKAFFISILTTKLYEWMLLNPSKDLQAIYYIDEISTYLPAGALKPVCKPILTLLYKQARKYGVGCIMSTQNPGDVDYKAFSQFGSWGIGRLTTQQDRDKIKDAIISIAKDSASDIIDKLPSLKPGNFILFSPDAAKGANEIKVRRLYTKHITLNDKDIKEITDDSIREEYSPYMIDKKATIDDQEEEKTININSNNDNNIDQTNSNSLKEKETSPKSEEEKELKIEKLASTSKKSNQIKKCLKLNLTNDEAINLVYKKISRKFFFGKPRETIHDLKLVFEPIIRTKVKQAKKVFFKNKIEEYEIFFEGNHFSIIDFDKNCRYQGLNKLFDLSEDSLKVMKLLDNGLDISKHKVQVNFGFDDKRMKSVIKELKSKKLITIKKEKDIEYLISITDLNLINSLNNVDFKNLEYESRIIKEIDSYKIDSEKIDKIQFILNNWYLGSEITFRSVIYLPLYEVVLIDENGKLRKLFIDAHKSKII